MDDRVELTEDVRKKLLGQYFVYSDYRSGEHYPCCRVYKEKSNY